MPAVSSGRARRLGLMDLEQITQPLYDSVDITAATTQAQFFVSALGKTRRQTNFTTSGQLAAPKQYLVKAVRLTFPQQTPLADLILIYNTSYFRLQIGEKVYLELPLILVTAGSGLQGASEPGALGTTQVWGNGWPVQNNLYILEHPILIPPMQLIDTSIRFDAAPAALTATVGAQVYLEGELSREIQ